MANLPLPENGDVWINAEQRALKYHINNVNQTILPQDWYTAGTPVVGGQILNKPGYVVSLVEQSNNSRIVRTDSATTLKTIGINLNSADVGDPVEVQRTGVFYYDAINWPVAPFLSSQIGETAYVTDSPDGQITTDKNYAILNGNNLIVVGQIVSERELLIAVSGDGRGPTDYDEIEYTIGEEIDGTGNPVLVSIRQDGKVYKTSKQISTDRYNAVGFIIGVSTILPAETRVIVLQSGKLTGFSGLTPGLPVYASGTTVNTSWGGITQNPASISNYVDKHVYVGHAYSTSTIIVNINPAYSAYDDTKIGSIILCDASKSESDTGFLYMDGSVLNAVTNPEYQDLYNVVGNTWGGTDNTNFVLEDLNVGALKYQIKYKYFYQHMPIYTPVYRIEYPSSTTWETFINDDVIINTTSFGFISEEIMKEMEVSVYAKKNSSVIKLPDLFTINPGTGNESYGYNLVYQDTTHVRLNLAPNGLAFIDNTDTLIAIDTTWEIKIIITKNERYNNYRDTDADLKLNHIFNRSIPFLNEIGANDYLIGLWDFDNYGMGDIQVLDYSGQQYHASSLNLTAIPGVLGGAVDFNGVDSSFDTPSLDLNSSTKFSIAFWNSVNAIQNTSTLIRYGQINSSGIVLQGNNSSSGNADLILNSTGITETIVINNFFSTSWAFYCIEIDNTNKIYSIWKNDRVLQSGNYTTDIFLNPFTTLRIGQYDSSNYMFGALDELRFYRNLLTKEEKLFLYQLGEVTFL